MFLCLTPRKFLRAAHVLAHYSLSRKILISNGTVKAISIGPRFRNPHSNAKSLRRLGPLPIVNNIACANRNQLKICSGLAADQNGLFSFFDCVRRTEAIFANS